VRSIVGSHASKENFKKSCALSNGCEWWSSMAGKFCAQSQHRHDGSTNGMAAQRRSIIKIWLVKRIQLNRRKTS